MNTLAQSFSLFIAPQTLSCVLRRKDLHNLRSELQCDKCKCENASHPGPVNDHRFRAGSVFDHINDHRQLWTTCETQLQRGLKSTGNRPESTEKHYKSPEKIFSHCLGAGCRVFESPHSDHLRTESLIQWLSTEIFFL